LVGDPPFASQEGMVIWYKYWNYKLNNNQFSPNAISHKKLNDFLIQAQKEISSFNTPENYDIEENQNIKSLITNWTETSQELLLMLKKKETILTKNNNPKSLMAFGAMGAHINMALQALKAAESDE
tara:strand:- start:457 stop:834 length:378 start_codon:yes stop_codon:yes gene_type:complete